MLEKRLADSNAGDACADANVARHPAGLRMKDALAVDEHHVGKMLRLLFAQRVEQLDEKVGLAKGQIAGQIGLREPHHAALLVDDLLAGRVAAHDETGARGDGIALDKANVDASHQPDGVLVHEIAFLHCEAQNLGPRLPLLQQRLVGLLHDLY